MLISSFFKVRYAFNLFILLAYFMYTVGYLISKNQIRQFSYVVSILKFCNNAKVFNGVPELELEFYFVFYICIVNTSQKVTFLKCLLLLKKICIFHRNSSKKFLFKLVKLKSDTYPHILASILHVWIFLF